jgi:two-component system chemotaxis sensor kinase CheA
LAVSRINEVANEIDGVSSMTDEFFEEMLGEFLDESEELLTSLNDNLLKLDEWVNELGDETGRCDDDLMNEMFRSAHSLKGMSGMMGLDDINGLTHKVENVFDAARHDQLSLTPDIVELVFQAADRLSQMVESLKDPHHPSIESEDIVASIKKTLQAAGVDKDQGLQSDIEQALDSNEETVEESADPESNHPEAQEPATIEQPLVEQAPVEEDPSEEAKDDPALDEEGRVEQARNELAQNELALDEQASDEKSSQTAECGDVTADDDPFAGIEDDFSAPAEYFEIFIDEAATALERLTDILTDPREPLAGDHVDELLVAVHRIKGSAASIGMQRAAKLSHYIEDILQELRSEHKPLMPLVAEQMLACVDGLRDYVDGLRSRESQSDAFPQLIADLRSSYAGESSGRQANDVSVAVEATPQTLAEDSSWPMALREQIVAAAPPGSCGIIGRVELEQGQSLPGLKGCLIYKKLAQSGDAFHSDPPESTIADLEELTSMSFGVCTEVGVDELRRLIDVSGVTQIELHEFGEARSESADVEETSGSESARESESSANSTTSDPSEESNSACTPQLTAARTASQASENTKPSAEPNKPAETIRVDIDRLDHLMNLAGQLVINKARFAQIADSLKYLAARKQSAQAVGEVIGTLQKLGDAVTDTGNGSRLDTDVIGSHVRRMQAGLETVQRDVAQLTEARTRVGDLLEAVHQLDRVSDSMQKSVMDTRMVPIGPLFNRFKRVIRDISRNNGKDIRLVVHGEKTELDKRMIDELGDPLIHMIRTSADHGVESPEEREAAGKPRQGTVCLNAYHNGNSIVVQVKDDGKGLNADQILQKAIDKEIVSSADAEKLTNQQIYQLIWEPGFSTAKQVTDVSGRGMGMDIVRSAIEDLSGNVETDSVPGEGTTFTIKLPLTLAILPSLLARIGEDVFAMPIETVVEIVSVSEEGFSTVQGKRTASVRGRVVSIVDLFETFHWQLPGQRGSKGNDTALVIVQDEGRELALVVDELLGEQHIVIKSISENYRNVNGIAGASILGDGRVSLILDVPTIIEIAASPAQQPTV